MCKKKECTFSMILEVGCASELSCAAFGVYIGNMRKIYIRKKLEGNLICLWPQNLTTAAKRLKSVSNPKGQSDKMSASPIVGTILPRC